MKKYGKGIPFRTEGKQKASQEGGGKEEKEEKEGRREREGKYCEEE